MAGQNLKIQVILAAVNRLTEPLRSAAGQARILSGAIRENRNRINALNQTQARINGFREAVQQARQSTQAFRAAQARVQELAAQMRAAGGGTAQMRTQLERARQAVSQASARMEQHNAAALRMRNALREAGIDTQRLGQHEQRLRSDLAGATAEIERQRRRLADLERQQERVNAAGQRYQGMMSARNNLASAGMGMTMAGGGVLMTAKKIMAPGYDFEATMSRVQALTRLDKTSGEMDAMTQQARDLGAATMFSATEAAEGQAFLAMAGFTPDAILKSMPGMLDLAKAGGLEIGRAADISSNILTGFKLQASDMGGVGDALTATFTRSNVTMEMLAETMKYTAPVAAGLGVDLETAAAMAGKLGDAGIQGGMAGTAMAAIMTRLAAPPKMAAEAMETLGLKTTDAKGNLRAVPDILAEIARKTAKMGDAQRAEIFKGLAGQEAIKAMFTLVDKAGSGELQEFIKTLKASGGEAAVVAKVMGDNMMGTFDELTSAWEDLGIGLYDVNKGALRELIVSVTDVVNDFGKWARENKGLVSTLSKVVLVGAAVVALLGGLALAMAAIIGPFAMLKYGATLLGIKLPFLGAAIGKIIMVFRLLSMALLTSPFGLIVLLVTAAILLWKNWDWVCAKMGGIWERIKTAWDGGLTGILQLLAEWNPVSLFLSAFQAISNAVMGFFGLDASSSTVFASFGGNLMQGLIDGVLSKLNAVKDAITGAAGSAIGWFKEKLGIHSPSVVFAGLGGYTMQGLAQGLSQSAALPLAAVNDVAKQLASTKVVAGFGMALAGAAPALAGNLPPLSAMPAFDSRPPLSARASDGGAAGPTTISITINAAPGMDERALAQMVAEKIEEARRREERQARGRLSDFD